MPLMHVNFYSKVLRQHSAMDVLLPDEHEGQSFPKEHRWPTLYLLHGLSDDHSVWQRWSSLERYLWNRPLAVVMPTTLRGFYTDMRCGPSYFTFLSEELPELCEKLFHFSDAREDRFAAGLSMGGYGAFKLGLKCPERYAAVASLSGALDVAGGICAAFDYRQILPEYEWIFGPRTEGAGGSDDLFALAEKLVRSHLNIRPIFYQLCGQQDMLYPENVLFNKLFGQALSIEYHDVPGDHEWSFWDKHICNVLDWLPLREKSLP